MIYVLLVYVAASAAPIITSSGERKGIIPISVKASDHDTTISDVKEIVEIVTKVSSVLFVIESLIAVEGKVDPATVSSRIAAVCGYGNDGIALNEIVKDRPRIFVLR